MTDGSLRSAWEGNAEDWIRWARTPEHDAFFWRFGLPAFLEFLPPPGRRCLDVGCGEGRLSRVLRDRGYKVLGFDASPTLARAAAAHGEAVPVAVADAAALPVRARKADLVVSYMVLHDVDELDATVREAARVLGGGGRFCAAIVHPMNSAAEVREDGLPMYPHSYFEPRRNVEAIERNGLRMTFHSEHRPLERYFRALEDAGFLIEAVREPRPDPEFVDSVPTAGAFSRVPWAIFIRAIRALWASDE